MKITPSPNTFSGIYNQYYKKSFIFVKSYVHNDLAAEDITSDSLIKLWNKLKKDNIEYIEPLLLTILKNESIDYLRHEEIKQNAFDTIRDWNSYELSTRLASLEACNPDEIFSNEIKRIVNDTLKQLPHQTQQIFTLSRFDNKSNKEISSMLNISIKGVEYHISKALKILRVELKDYLLFLYLYLYYFKS